MSTLALACALYSTKYTTEIEPRRLESGNKTRFHTHTSSHAERLHHISEAILLPARWNAQLLGHIIEPLPGANKKHRLKGVIVRIMSLALWILTVPFAAVSAAVAFPLRYIDHHYRPAISFINNSPAHGAKIKTKEAFLLTKDNPLHIRTHNLGFVTSSMSIAGDLRPPIQRAKELVKHINEDPHKPDIIFFQETFHEDATKVLCEGIKQEYPYIIHSVAPQISGFSSGSAVASKFPIENVKFQRLGNMLGPESMSPRGVIRVRLESSKGPVMLYGVHTQALIGEARAKTRSEQLAEIKHLMEEDVKQEPNILQILLGDFNTSRVTIWGEDNLDPKGQSEEQVLERFDKYFDDPYLKDHDPITGHRTMGNPFYLQIDNHRLKENLEEPSGSWYHGPFADPGVILSKKLYNDRKKHKRPFPKKIHQISIQKNVWGTPEWRTHQTANTARFDYILFPKGQVQLEGRVEIRRVIVPSGAESASSDHLPVDGRIWMAT